MSDTYKFARSSGDRSFLKFIYERLENVHKESTLVDYMHTLHAFVYGINEVVEKAAEYDCLESTLDTVQKSLRL